MKEDEQELAFDYTVRTDARGVVDGRALAKEMMADAFKLMAAYGSTCMACCVKAFEEAGGAVLNDMKKAEEETGAIPTLYFCMKDHGSPEGQYAAFRAHVEEQLDKLIEKRTPRCHEHGEGGNA